MPESYRRNPNTKCIICSKPIYKRPFEIKQNKGRVFCSVKCYGISNRKEKPCVVCGALILASAHKKTCSRSCANKHRAGIKYTGRRIKDKVKTYNLQKSRLVEVRGPKCERCGYNRLAILQVHHKDRDRSNNNLENLELVCPNCHFEEHYLK